MKINHYNYTSEIEGSQEAACAAASWRPGPEPAKSNEMELSWLKDLAAFTALRDWILRELPSCSANISVLIYAIIWKEEDKIS